MITKEIVNGEEFFAVDGPIVPCKSCAFDLGVAPCVYAKCHPHERDDTRSVYFQPLSDLRTMVKYLLQENPHEHNTSPDRTQG